MSVAGPSSTFFAWLRIGTAFGSLAINAVANFAPGANSPPLPSDEHRWIGGQGKGRAIHPKTVRTPAGAITKHPPGPWDTVTLHQYPILADHRDLSRTSALADR